MVGGGPPAHGEGNPWSGERIHPEQVGDPAGGRGSRLARRPVTTTEPQARFFGRFRTASDRGFARAK